MQGNILTEVMGDTPNIKLLGFLLENPFDAYSITDLNKFTGIAKDTIKKYLQFFKKRNMVCCKEGRWPKYGIYIENPYVRRIEANMFDFIDIEDEPESDHFIPGEGKRPFFNFLDHMKEPKVMIMEKKTAGA